MAQFYNINKQSLDLFKKENKYTYSHAHTYAYFHIELFRYIYREKIVYNSKNYNIPKCGHFTKPFNKHAGKYCLYYFA